MMIARLITSMILMGLIRFGCLVKKYIMATTAVIIKGIKAGNV